MDESSGAYPPDAAFTITSLETLKVFSDPLRQQIIEALLDAPKTVKQIASELGLVPTKLYYHVNLLEEHALIRVVDTRIVSGIIEKRYSLAARNYTISRTLLTPGQRDGDLQGLEAVLQATIERVQWEIQQGVQNGVIDTSEGAPPHRKLMIGQGRHRLTKAQAEALYTRLVEMLTEFEATPPTDETGDSDTSLFRVMFALYPLGTPTVGQAAAADDSLPDSDPTE
ncbi:MAG: winged helix-turn-helix domain-containing protein [bacterium]|nr:winged helix-turn-helix domain-containing protein [bacterium]